MDQLKIPCPAIIVDCDGNGHKPRAGYKHCKISPLPITTTPFLDNEEHNLSTFGGMLSLVSERSLCYNRWGVADVFELTPMDSESSGIFNYIEQEKSASRPSRVPHALAIAASMVIIMAGIYAASSLLGPMLLALFLAIVLLVPLRWLQKQGCPQFLAFLFVMLCSIALLGGVLYFIGGSMNNFIGKIPAIGEQVVVRYNQLVVRYNQLENQLAKWGFMIGEGQKNGQAEPDPSEPPTNEPAVPEAVSQVIPSVVSVPATADEANVPEGAEPPESETDETGETELTPKTIPSLSPEEQSVWERKAEEAQLSLISLDKQSVALWLTRIALYARHMLEGGFLVIIFTIFMLLEASYLPVKINRAFGKDSPINIEHFHRIADDVRRYLILKTVSNLMSGAAAMAVYWMFGVPEAFFWGIIAFFMYYIPNIGGTLAAIIPGILIFITKDVSWVVLYAFCLLTIECTIAYGIEPKLLGHGLRLSTMVIILSLFFWGFLLGPIGLFLAAPLTVMIKIILQAFPETRWIAIFLDGGREKRH